MRKKSVLSQLNFLTPEEIIFIRDTVKKYLDGNKKHKENLINQNKALAEMSVGMQGFNSLYSLALDKTPQDQINSNLEDIVECEKAVLCLQSIDTKLNQFEGII